MRGITFMSRWCGRAPIFISLLGGAVLVSVSPALATPPTFAAPEIQSNQSTNEPTSSSGFFTGLSRRDSLLGDMWGLHPWLSKYGLSLSILETSEVLGNVSGGVNQGFDYDGLTQMILQLDTQRAFQLVWRHLQRQRPSNPRPQSKRRQPLHLADRQRD